MTGQKGHIIVESFAQSLNQRVIKGTHCRFVHFVCKIVVAFKSNVFANQFLKGAKQLSKTLAVFGAPHNEHFLLERLPRRLVLKRAKVVARNLAQNVQVVQTQSDSLVLSLVSSIKGWLALSEEHKSEVAPNLGARAVEGICYSKHLLGLLQLTKVVVGHTQIKVAKAAAIGVRRKQKHYFGFFKSF